MGDVLRPVSMQVTAADTLRKEIAVAAKKALESGVSPGTIFDVMYCMTQDVYARSEGPGGG